MCPMVFFCCVFGLFSCSFLPGEGGQLAGRAQGTLMCPMVFFVVFFGCFFAVFCWSRQSKMSPDFFCLLNEKYTNLQLQFRCWILFVKVAIWDVFRALATFFDFGQKTRKRTGMTRLGSPGLSSQSVSGFSGRKRPKKPETDRLGSPGVSSRSVSVFFLLLFNKKNNKLHL